MSSAADRSDCGVQPRRRELDHWRVCVSRRLGSAYRGRYFYADFVTARVWSIALIPAAEGGSDRVGPHRAHRRAWRRGDHWQCQRVWPRRVRRAVHGIVSYSSGRILKVVDTQHLPLSYRTRRLRRRWQDRRRGVAAFDRGLVRSQEFGRQRRRATVGVVGRAARQRRTEGDAQLETVLDRIEAPPERERSLQPVLEIQWRISVSFSLGISGRRARIGLQSPST